MVITMLNNFIQKTDQAIQEINLEIKAHENGNGTISNLSHLNLIKTELEKMKKYQSKRDFKPYYPRQLADSWDYNHKLTILLGDILTLYNKLN